MEELIRTRLIKAFSPSLLQIDNQSALHHGHRDSPESGESHFQIILNAQSLEGLSRLEQQRRVYAALGDIFEKGVHAISLKINLVMEHVSL